MWMSNTGYGNNLSRNNLINIFLISSIYWKYTLHLHTLFIFIETVFFEIIVNCWLFGFLFLLRFVEQLISYQPLLSQITVCKIIWHQFVPRCQLLNMLWVFSSGWILVTETCQAPLHCFKNALVLHQVVKTPNRTTWYSIREISSCWSMVWFDDVLMLTLYKLMVLDQVTESQLLLFIFQHLPSKSKQWKFQTSSISHIKDKFLASVLQSNGCKL